MLIRQIQINADFKSIEKIAELFTHKKVYVYKLKTLINIY
jgi:hypothetical protein